MALADELRDLGTETVTECVICRTPGEIDRQWAEWLALPAPYGVLRCNCGLRWLSPRPTEAGLSVIYSNRYYFASGDAADYSGFVGHRLDHFLTRIRKHIKPGSRLLDYGAATGEFVKLAREEGVDADGIELSSDARETALTRYGISLLKPDQLLNNAYDVVHMNHVLEHVPDPLSHLIRMKSALKTGGRIIVEVPNQFRNLADSLRRFQGSGGRQAQFDAFSLHHTYFFTPRTLTLLGDKAGIETERIRTIASPQHLPMSAKRKALEAVIRWAAHFGLGDAIEWVGSIKRNPS